MEEDKKRKTSLLNFILIFIIIVLCIFIFVLCFKLHNAYNNILNENEIEEIDNSKEVDSGNIELDKDYSSVYEKYRDEKIYWLIKDKKSVEDRFPNGANAISYVDDDFENAIESYITNNYYKLDYSILDGKIRILFFPIAGQSMEEMYLITDKGSIYANYDVNTHERFDFKKIKEFNQEIIDVCENSDGINLAIAESPFFLMTDGSLKSLNDIDYGELSSEFKKAKSIKKDYIELKYFYCKNNTFIHVTLEDNEFNEETREFWYSGCDEKIKDIEFSINKGLYNNDIGKIEDIYILTENNNVYAYPLSYTYSSDIYYKLFKIASNVKNMEYQNDRFVIVTNDGEVIDGVEALYADGY